MSLLRFTAALLLLSLLAAPLLAQTKGKKNKKKNADEPVPAQPAETVKPLAAADEAEEAVEGEDIPRVIPVFDPGSHTQSICAMGFSSDKKKLITVGEDSSIQVWSTSTGERLDILRLPAFGHEQVSSVNAWHTATVSHDGRYVAIGGGVRQSLSEGDASERAKLMVVDIEKRTVNHLRAPSGEVTALAIAPDYRLAVAFGGRRNEIIIYPEITATEVRRRESTVLKGEDLKRNADFLQFSPDGKQLLSSHRERDFVFWNLGTNVPTITQRFGAQAQTSCIAWSPDRKQFARALLPGVQGKHGFEIRSAEGKLLQEHLFKEIQGFASATDLRSISYVNPQTLLFCSSDSNGSAEPGAFAYLFDLTTGQAKRIFEDFSAGIFHTAGAVSADGELGAITVSMGLDAVVFRVKDGAVVARCGAASPVPTLVGWAAADRPAGFAWSELRHRRKFNTEPTDLQFGFDLVKMEPIAEVRPADYGVLRESVGEWSIRKQVSGKFDVNRGEESIGTIQGFNGILARSLIPRGDEPPLVIWAANKIRTGSSRLSLSKSDGTTVTRLFPDTIFVRDVAPAPDGRFAIVSTGAHQLNIYTTDGQAFPFLSFARVNGEWVIWSREGYFAASPGGEKLFGWAVSNGPDRLSTFYPAEKFSKHFHRPDLLKRAIQLGSIEAALKQQTEARAPALEQLLPPKGTLTLLKQTDGRVQVQASAIPGAPDKPVVAMRLLLDGRPLTNGVGTKTVAPGEKAEATWELEFPAGTHELKLLVRGEDSSAVSDPLVLKGPKSESQISVLHRICVGVDQYALPALNLTSAAKDATDVFAALERHCVGEHNRFGRVNGTLLTNSQATRSTVLKAIADIRKVAKAGDIVVFLFAGHGIAQPHVAITPQGIKRLDEYYLMTHEADPNQSLKDKSLSGSDLRLALADIECPVLLVMDSCHSASGVKAFRPATDDLTRGLTDASAGVTVLAAAMSHEVASATAENGHFTAAFLKALQVGEGVPYDPHEHVLYTHHIYSVVFSEVRKATNGKQNPFLNMPWTVPPLALRDVPFTK
ncbi:WD domain, G-beta repeat [Anatilimnocola aggregata]|uniref:WD domain, G-beta repeat n=1 Tax=Anatilimnocola aggregata TaxID=2528021 RepID=A0A517YDR3_9BACT|nr:caspase family protein [Anatilimnocola aggregata]QDU28371.1 WD domain, G-beta repeat [Anatilimnocola aggregata]